MALPTRHRVQPIRRATRIPVWADVAGRLGLALALVMLVILVHWLDRAGLRDSYDGEISFLDVVYFTMISITTTGFGDIAPISDRARLIEAVIVTPIRIAVLFIFVGTAYTFVIKRSWEKWRMARIQRELTDHFVILGFGTSGSEAAKELVARGIAPHRIVVVEQSGDRITEAEDLGCNVLLGDATRDETLLDVRVPSAHAVLVSAGRDDSSILIVLTVRHLAERVPISVVIRAQDNELLAKQAGANTVINPVSFTGLLLAGSAQGSHIADYMSDLASVSGAVQLRERAILPEEIGGSLDALASGGRGLRLYRGNQAYGFRTAEAQSLQPGDCIVEVVQCDDADSG